MEVSGEFYKILTASTELRPDSYRSIDYLGIDVQRFHFSVRQPDFQIFRNVITIIPSNFPRISYLNLDGCRYFRSRILTDVSSKMKNSQIREMREDILFRSHLRIYIATTHRFGMRHFYSNWTSVNDCFCLLLHSFFKGCDYRMRELLQYGIQRIPASKMTLRFRDLGRHPLYQMYCVYELMEEFGFNLPRPHPDWKDHYINRTFLITDMLFMLFNMYKPPRGNWKRCYRLLWRSIPDPYLSFKEIWIILYIFAGRENTPNERIRKRIKSVYLVYTRNFPEMYTYATRPRSLLHLCRCIIRNSMIRSFSLPHGINKLEIPRTLKAFLKLDS